MLILVDRWRVLEGHVLDVLRGLPANSVHCVVTSPPYWGLRDYGLPPSVWGGQMDCGHDWSSEGQRHRGGPQGKTVHRSGRDTTAQDATRSINMGATCSLCGAWHGCLGHEPTPQLFVDHLVEVFREVRRILRPEGTLWLNLGDSYFAGGSTTTTANDFANFAHKTGLVGNHPGGSDGRRPVKPRKDPDGVLKPKDLIGIPWRVALALQADGWWLRSDIIWAKNNVLPSSVTDRPTTNHEHVFLLTKKASYYYDHHAIKERAATGEWDAMPPIGGVGKAHGRPQTERALELAKRAGLTWDHIDAIRSAGVTDTGKAQVTQTGFGKNTEKVQQLAVEAKKALGGYYREFLSEETRRRYKEASEISIDGARGNPTYSGNRPSSAGLRNKRTVWPINTRPFPEAHFAVFPSDLVEPCVKAGTSERGACKECGAPLERVLEQAKPPAVEPSSLDRYGTGEAGIHRKIGQAYQDWMEANPARTVAWTKPCQCPTTETRPCVVLDPFTGSGTTGVVAKQYHRDFIGVELNPDYAQMARRRIGSTAAHRPLWAWGDEDGQDTQTRVSAPGPATPQRGAPGPGATLQAGAPGAAEENPGRSQHREHAIPRATGTDAGAT